MQHRAPGITGNDRKFETWTLSCPTNRGFATKQKTLEVYAVPSNGFRGATVSKFRASYDGVVFEDTDIVKLREALDAHHIGVQEAEYEKVLVIETDGARSYSRGNSEEFSLTWTVCWLVRRLGFVYDETKTYKRTDVPRSAWEPELDPEPDQNSHRRMAVVAWTQAREDALATALVSIARLRETVAEGLKDSEKFAAKLDSASLLALTAGSEREEK